MKTAILHDYVEGFSGSTRVLDDLLKAFPGSDLFTLYVDPREKRNKELLSQTNKLTVSWIGKTPWFYKLPFYRTMSLMYSRFFWESIDLSDYDVVIGSTFGFGAQGAIVKPEAVYAVYVHSPSKRFYSERNMIVSKSNWLKNIFHNLVLAKRRDWDFIAGQRPDFYWSNSKYTQSKVWRNWRRESEVLYPRIKDFTKGNIGTEVGSYYIYFGRLVLEKGIELIINAFNESGRKLVIVGDGEKKIKDYLRSIAGKNIKFKGFVEEKELLNIYKNSKAMVFAAKGEDFGMVVAETVVAGVPVVAYKGGGVKEIVTNGISGYLFEEYNTKSLNQAVDRIEELKFNRCECRKAGQCFLENNFIEKIQSKVDELIKQK